MILPSDTPGSTQVELVGGTASDGRRGRGRHDEVFDEAAPGAGWRRAPSLRSRAATTTRCCCPTARWSPSAAGAARSRATSPVRPPSTAERRPLRPGDPDLAPRPRPAGGARLPLDRAAAARRPRLLGGRRHERRRPAADTAEIYSPPYLFNGPRPAITGAPGRSPTAAALPGRPRRRRRGPRGPGRPGRHDPRQRHEPALRAARRHGPRRRHGRRRRALRADVAPPGYYMLFLLNARGVPSVARWVRLGGTSPAPEPPAPPAPTPTPTAPTPTPTATPSPTPAPVVPTGTPTPAPVATPAPAEPARRPSRPPPGRPRRPRPRC